MSSAYDFSGKVVLVTGSSSGIGASTAILFAKTGASVVLTGRNKENLEKIYKQCVVDGKPKPLIIQADVTVENDVKKIIDSTIKHFGKLDILVNNAGIAEVIEVEKGSLEHFDKIINTNLRSVYYLTSLAIPYLVATKGSVVNVSSLAGIRAYPAMSVYCMSKGALDQFTRCLSLELAPKGVRVNSVNPGVTVTEIFSRGGFSDEKIQEFLAHHRTITPLGRVAEAGEVAEVIMFLASEKAAFITGIVTPIDGGRSNVCPR